MALKPLTSVVLDKAAVKADRKKSGRFDQCGIGELAVYVPSKLEPRAYYIPYEKLERVYQRIAVSKGSGKAFMTPVLYVVFQYEGGQEKEVYFKYINDADKMFAKLEKEHPQVPLVSEKNEQKQKEAAAVEKKIRTAQLSKEGSAAVRDLRNAKNLLEMKPALYKDLAQTARFKRSMDLIKPGFQILALALLIAGAVTTVAGAYLYKTKGNNATLLMLMGGIAVVFLMINSGMLPTAKKNRKSAGKAYNAALEAMRKSVKAAAIPVPVEYAHPYTLEMMEHIIREGKCETNSEALEILKEELKAMDSSVSLGGEKYKQVVTVKPLFLVNDYK